MVSPSQGNSGTANGFLRPQSTWGDLNNIGFVVQQLMGRMQTATLVEVVSCTNSGGVSSVGYVDVVPMVNQIDGLGNATPHDKICNVPYLRIQGGSDAVIIDPKVGDIGLCAFSSRDISKVKATRKRANPGSFRQYAFSDAMYIGGMLNGTPTQFVRFSPAGIEITSSVAVTINTPLFTVNGATILNGTLSQGNGTAGGDCHMLGPLIVTNDVTVQGTSVHTHKHSGVTTGTGQTGNPV